jgi:hypothetical protein
VNVKVTHNDETADLFVWDRKIEMIVHTLMQKAPIVDPSSGEMCPELKGRLPFMLESFTQVCESFTEVCESTERCVNPSQRCVNPSQRCVNPS